MLHLRPLTAFVALLAWTSPAFAGMPAPFRLAEAATRRVETISFFLLVFLGAALLIRAVWNSLRSDFPRLPHLSYMRSLGLVLLWGLLFFLVLTMISGARELLTPGAWKPDGVTYSLKDPAKDAEPSDDLRAAKLSLLHASLWEFAQKHEGKFPPANDPAIPEARWQTPHASRMRYLYVPGLTVKDTDRVLAYEPGLYGDPHSVYVVFADGAIKRLNTVDLTNRLNAWGK